MKLLLATLFSIVALTLQAADLKVVVLGQ